MFLAEEISACKKLYMEILHEDLSDFLTKRELNTIREQEMAFMNLRNRLIPPRNFNKPGTGNVFSRIVNRNFPQ